MSISSTYSPWNPSILAIAPTSTRAHTPSPPSRAARRSASVVLPVPGTPVMSTNGRVRDSGVVLCIVSFGSFGVSSDVGCSFARDARQKVTQRFFDSFQ